MILAAAHLACSAQTNAKIEALYAYLKAQGIDNGYKLRNLGEDGLRKQFVIHLDLYDENRLPTPTPASDIDSIFRLLPGAGVDEAGNHTISGKIVKKLLVSGKEIPLDGHSATKSIEQKLDSTYRAKAIKNRDAYNMIRRTVSELQENAAESYSYEYHQNGADTIITTMALNNPANNSSTIFSHKHNSYPVAQVVRAPELVYFNYCNMSKRMTRLSPYAPVGYLHFQYDGIIDSTQTSTKDFDIATLKKKLAPIFKDKNIKRHELLCRHDATFDRGAYNDSLNRIGQHSKGIRNMTMSSMGPGGESHYTIYKFTNEEQAKSILRQVLDCVRQHIADDPQQAYEVISDARFGAASLIDILSTYPCSQTYNDLFNGKREAVERLEIQSYMDSDGFYIITNLYRGDNSFPHEWKSLKSMVNGRKEYYKESL